MTKEYGVDLIGAEALGIKRRNPLGLLVSTFLVLTLLLGGCSGDDGGEADVAPAAQDQQAVEATEEVEENDALTETLEAAETTDTTVTETSDIDAEEVAVITDTQLITQTEVTTDVTVTTDTVVIEENLVTTVVTDTELVTSVVESSDSSTATESEIITSTEEIAPETEVTGTGGVVTETGMTDAADDMSAMMGVTDAGNQYVRASTLLDYNFENMDGEVSGDLEDLLIDLATGRVLFTSIEYGGVLDLGDKDIVVPLNAFAIGQEGELVLNIDETALENYPDVGNEWPNLDDPVWDDDVNAFWAETGIASNTNFEEPTTSVAWASDLMGHNVADLGFGAGSVLDILVNLGSAQASYIIVDYGEGLDADPYIIPLAAYDVSNWGDELGYGADFTPDLLENAPRFDQDMYPEGSPLDNDFGDRIESAWNDLGFSNDLNRDDEID